MRAPTSMEMWEEIRKRRSLRVDQAFDALLNSCAMENPLGHYFQFLPSLSMTPDDSVRGVPGFKQQTRSFAATQNWR